MIYWGLCKKFKFDPTNKGYKHNPEFILENEMHKPLRDFGIQADHLISAKLPDLVIKKGEPAELVDCRPCKAQNKI